MLKHLQASTGHDRYGNAAAVRQALTAGAQGRRDLVGFSSPLRRIVSLLLGVVMDYCTVTCDHTTQCNTIIGTSAWDLGGGGCRACSSVLRWCSQVLAKLSSMAAALFVAVVQT